VRPKFAKMSPMKRMQFAAIFALSALFTSAAIARPQQVRPRPSSPAEIWLWKQAQDAKSVTLTTYEWSPHLGLQRGDQPELTIYGRADIRALCNALRCSQDVPRDGIDTQGEENAAYMAQLTFKLRTRETYTSYLEFNRGNKRYFFRRPGGVSARFRDGAEHQFFAVASKLISRAKHHAPHLKLVFLEPGN